MRERESRPSVEEAAPGSGGPVDSILGVPDCPCAQATAWRVLCSSGHVLDLIAEYAEWMKRKVDAETSHAISEGPHEKGWRDRFGRAYWTIAAGAPTYEQIARRRLEGSPLFPGHPTNKSGAQLRAEARASWAEVNRKTAQGAK